MASTRILITRFSVAVLTFGLLCGGNPLVCASSAQVVGTAPNSLGGPPSSPFPNQPRSLDAPVAAGIPPRMVAAAALARENERQRKLVEDSDKLLMLATQLHAEVGRTDKNILSVDVVRRAEEIEKLARSVKDRMRAE